MSTGGSTAHNLADLKGLLSVEGINIYLVLKEKKRRNLKLNKHIRSMPKKKSSKKEELNIPKLLIILIGLLAIVYIIGPTSVQTTEDSGLIGVNQTEVIVTNEEVNTTNSTLVCDPPFILSNGICCVDGDNDGVCNIDQLVVEDAQKAINLCNVYKAIGTCNGTRLGGKTCNEWLADEGGC